MSRDPGARRRLPPPGREGRAALLQRPRRGPREAGPARAEAAADAHRAAALAGHYYRPTSRGLAQLLGDVGPTSYDKLIRETAARYDLEYALVKAVIKAESSFNRMAVSPKGALGLMQLMPKTARMHGVRNVFMPHENIEGGCRHLRMLHDRYRGNIPLIVAAYNAGERRVDDGARRPEHRGDPRVPGEGAAIPARVSARGGGCPAGP